MESTSIKAGRALILYDDDCSFCKATKNIVLRWIADREKVSWLPFSSDQAGEILNTLDEDRYESVVFVTQDGRVLRYEDAIIAILKLNDNFKLILGHIYAKKQLRVLLRRSYIWIAHHRNLALKFIPKSYRDLP
jgi:predicted DCC family thiol-disulfide oxidoreductase YuxK